MGLVRFGVSMPIELLERFDRLIARKGYSCRSEAVGDMIRDRLVEEEWKAEEGEVAGTITVVYDHHTNGLSDLLNELQHGWYENLRKSRTLDKIRGMNYLRGRWLFDKVICLSTFPHLDNKSQALREIARVLGEGGSLLIAHHDGREKVNSLHREVGGVIACDQIPDWPEMVELVSSAGFQVVARTDREDLYVLVAAKLPVDALLSGKALARTR